MHAAAYRHAATIMDRSMIHLLLVEDSAAGRIALGFLQAGLVRLDQFGRLASARRIAKRHMFRHREITRLAQRAGFLDGDGGADHSCVN